MITIKEKEIYHSPRVRVAWLNPEGLLCDSVKVTPDVKEWDNMNAKQGSDLWGSPVIES